MTDIQESVYASKLVPSGIRVINEKAMQMERGGKQVIHLEIGRPDFDTPAYIKASCIKSLEEGKVFYTSNLGLDGLRQAIAKKLHRENDLNYDSQNVLVTVGLSEAIFVMLTAMLNPGDEILVPDPVWINYINVPKMLGAIPVTYGLSEENLYQPSISEIRKKITARTKAIVIVSPNNPTGSVLKKDFLEELAELVKLNNLWIISDEIYEKLIFDGEKHISIGSLPGMEDRTFTMNGFSKAFSMTGWRLGYVAAPREWIKIMNKVHQHNVTCAPSFVQYAAIEALRGGEKEISRMVKEYAERRDAAVEILNNSKKVHCIKPAGTFYIFINIKGTGISATELAERLLREKCVAMVPGDVFGEKGKGYLRMSFANSIENIKEGCRRLVELSDN